MVGACQQNSGIFLVRGGGLGLEICGVRRRTGSETKLRVYCCEKQDGADGGAGDQITGQAADSERPGAGRDTGGNRGRNWDKMPTGAEAEQAGSSDKMPAGTEAGTGTRCRRGPRLSRQGARSGQGPDEIPAGAEAGTGTRCRRGPRLSRQGANQLKRKRSIISSNNPGFSKSFSLVIIKLLCSKNPASW